MAVGLMAHNLCAQSRLAYSEFGMGIGTMNYSGDIATTKSTAALVQEARPNVTVFAKRHLNDWFGFGMQSSYGWIYASDLNHTHQNRGLEVSTSVFQINPFIEISFIRFGKFHYERKFSIYTRAGGGLVAYNPDPSANEIYPPELDPNPNAYSGINFFVAPGIKFRLGYKTILSLEMTLHSTTKDNMDGVLSKNVMDGGANDTYGGINIMISKAVF